jgi:hypothetical protein
MHILARAELVDDPIASDLMRRVLRREHGAIVKVAEQLNGHTVCAPCLDEIRGVTRDPKPCTEPECVRGEGRGRTDR